MPNISALGLDTSNYTTSAAFFGDGEMDSRGMILPVKEGEIGLRQSDAVFHHHAPAAGGAVHARC